MKTVSVIIPTYRDWERLSKCLNAIKKQRYPAEFIQVIVINNDPFDNNPFINSDEYKNVKFLVEGKVGSYAARNKGLNYAKGEIIAFTDSDCVPDEFWISNAVRHFEENSKCTRIGGKIELFFKGNVSKTLAEFYEQSYAFRQKEFVQRQGMAATANMFSYKKVFDDISYFNDSLMSGGDAEWGVRANNKGYRIDYCDSVTVYHPARESMKQIFIKNRREASGKIKNKRKVLINFVMSLLPPLKSLMYIRYHGNSIYKVLIAFFIRYLMRIDTAIEQIRVVFFNKKAERL
ncbi:glycosyltransferase [Escherichia coli]|uniref:glycosyltransferase n=1 Tax=Escherichia coli TaxID=562 RepID=UPI000CDC6AE8|nr:glycosyltransferase [Escherichia coli]AUX64535.1 glycosyl transferase family 2 [Escherichia coli]